jgi:hypothetical protein
MKGIEGVPIKLALICIVVAIVLYVFSVQFGAFSEFRTEKDFKEDMLDFVQSIRNLQTTSDYGAFTSVRMVVPSGSGLVLDIDNDTIMADFTDETVTMNLDMNITSFKGDEYVPVERNGTIIINPGKYNIVLYYGSLEDDQIKSWTMTFK